MKTMTLKATTLTQGKYTYNDKEVSLLTAFIILYVCSTSFKDEFNVKVTDKLVREVKSANPAFQNGLIRGEYVVLKFI